MGINHFRINHDSISSPALSVEDKNIRLLQDGKMVSCILMPTGSNYTFITEIKDDSGLVIRAVYKPKDGEMPLWDFGAGTLYKREYAAYLLSKALGWGFVPETVIRDGPYGVGSVQRYVDHERDTHYRTIRGTHTEELRTIACFDIIANNADRKAVHCFKGCDGRIWGIDHGLTFNHVMKLRTVIWDFWGEPFPSGLRQPMEEFLKNVESPSGEVKDVLNLLESVEVEALIERVRALVSMGGFPQLRRY